MLQDYSPEELRTLIAELQSKASKAELTEQKLRDTYSKLDSQLARFTHIHKYALGALTAADSDELYTLVAEGMIDIFQLGSSALFSVNTIDNSLGVLATCNLDLAKAISLPRNWIKKHDLWNALHNTALLEDPAASPLWLKMGLGKVMFMPLFSNDRRLAAVLMGGIKKSQIQFYDFSPDELAPSFMVYCQLINGIINNAFSLAEAKRNAQIKSRFLANLSHEIRTPMNAIVGMVQIAKRSSEVDEIKKNINQIAFSSQHLLRLLNEVLDIAKIEENKLVLSKEPFSLQSVINIITSTFSSVAEQKKQNFTINEHGLANLKIMGDPTRLGQVLLNLISNALKFTPEGGSIHLDINEMSRDSQKVLLRFSVTDNGIGINAEVQKNLFSPFEQGDSGISRKYGGTGLGLALCQRIVELMGGTIFVSSCEGRGSSFFFHLHLDLANTEDFTENIDENCILKEDETDVPDFSKYRVLIVDDIAINREIAATLLENTNIMYDTAENGEEAVAKFMRSNPAYYDCILMDMQMPVMDGCTAAKIIRTSGRPDAKIAILAFTANVFTEDVQEALAAGMNGYIAKPLEYSALVNSLGKILCNNGKTTQNTPSSQVILPEQTV